jgi:hypothetical protein
MAMPITPAIKKNDIFSASAFLTLFVRRCLCLFVKVVYQLFNVLFNSLLRIRRLSDKCPFRSLVFDVLLSGVTEIMKSFGMALLVFLLFSRRIRNPFFLLFYGTDMCCSLAIPQWFTSTLSASVRRSKHFHYVQQVCLLFGKQSTKSVYLFRAYIFTAVRFSKFR